MQEFPIDVKIVRGKELLCREGCLNNPLLFLQKIAFDYKEKFKGGWFLVIGKGHDDNLTDQLKAEGFTKGLVAGYCAINEVGEKLRVEFGKRKVSFSGDCNNLADTATAMLKLSRMNVFDLVPIPVEEATKLLMEAREHGSKALIPALR